MRTFALVVIAALLALGAVASPSGMYCGSYMGMVSGKVTFASSTIDVKLDVFSSKHECDNVAYSFNGVTNAINIPSATDKSSCLGDLISSNAATYHPGANTISLDVGIATIDMSSCKQ